MEKIIRIDCKGADVLPVTEFENFYGELKKIDKRSLKKIKQSVIDLGFSFPICVWKDSNGRHNIIDGHQRLYAVKELLKEGYLLNEVGLPVCLVSASSVKEAKKKVLVATSVYGKVTEESLYSFLKTAKLGIEDVMPLISLPGIDLGIEHSLLMDSPKDDKMPIVELIPEFTKQGDFYQLGNHYLLCGDSTLKKDIERLLQGNTPILMVTDPPYGVNYDPEWREKAGLQVGESSTGKVKNDDQVDWTAAYKLFPGDVAYVWHAGRFTHIVSQNLIDCGFEITSQIIWKKQHFAISRGDYHWRHEPCIYAVRKGKKHNWQGARNQCTVWDIANNGAFGNPDKEKTWGHGTQKPLKCMLKPIINNSSHGDMVYDPFAGSGTTLIACEKAGRKCFTMEISPRYCDIIIKRWEEYTGKEALKL